jgi:hypothetical protein
MMSVMGTDESPEPEGPVLYDWSAKAAEDLTRSRTTRLRRRATIAVASVAALGIVATVAVLSVPKSWYSTNTFDRDNSLGPYIGQLPPAQRGQLDAEIPALKAFVAQQRGGRFPADVAVTYLPDARFVARLPQERSILDSANVTGVYIPSSKSLLIRGTYLDDATDAALVSVMTRAYDDSRFDVATIGADVPDTADGGDALAALVNGDAATVQTDFIESLPGDPCVLIGQFGLPYPPRCRTVGFSDTDNSTAGAADPSADAVATFPDTAGSRFVGALIATGGQAAVDRAFRHPPTDTAQIIDPQLYLRGVAAQRVAVPSTPTPPRTTGSLGALRVSLTLTDGVTDSGTGDYLHRWSGDAYATYRDAGEQCLRDSVVLQDRSATDTALARFREWQRSTRGRTIRRTSADELLLTRCTR